MMVQLVVCDHIEIAKTKVVDVKFVIAQMRLTINLSFMFLDSCKSSRNTRNTRSTSSVHVLTSLQTWATDPPAWEFIRGMDLLRPMNQRFNRMEQQRLAPFIVIESVGVEYPFKIVHSFERGAVHQVSRG